MQSLWLSCELELGETVSFADGLVCANAVFTHRRYRHLERMFETPPMQIMFLESPSTGWANLQMLARYMRPAKWITCEILGSPDDMRFRSTIILFARAAGPHSVYAG